MFESDHLGDEQAYTAVSDAIFATCSQTCHLLYYIHSFACFFEGESIPEYR